METLFGFDDLAAGTPCGPASSRLVPSDRQRLIERIMEMNPSASAAFLSQFETGQLGLYLEHLVSTQGPRGRDAIWARPGDTRAVLTARSAA